jgi:hypothetical protein
MGRVNRNLLAMNQNLSEPERGAGREAFTKQMMGAKARNVILSPHSWPTLGLVGASRPSESIPCKPFGSERAKSAVMNKKANVQQTIKESIGQNYAAKSARALE